MLADRCLQLLGNNGDGYGFDLVRARAKAVKGLVELVCGNAEAGIMLHSFNFCLSTYCFLL